MDIIDIKNIQGGIVFSAPVNEGSVYRKKLMSEDYISLRFNIDNPINFDRGYYAEYNGIRYEIIDITYPTYNTSTGGYDYELRLDAYYWKWKNKIFLYDRQYNNAGEASWHLTRTPDAHLSVICSNLAALGYTYNGTAFDFVIDGSVDMTSKLVSYDNTNIIDALTLIAEAWEAEWWIEDNIIHLGRCEYNTAIEFEHGKSVQSMSRSESNDNFATRIYAFGSDRNLPTNYRDTEGAVVNGVVQKRLMLPKGTPYIDAYDNTPQEQAVEAVVIFDDIYPRRIGTMSDITTKEYADEIENEDGSITEEKWNAYRYKDTGLTFKEEYRLYEKALEITFTSGSLNGMTFEVMFNPDGDPETDPKAQLWEIVRNEEYGTSLPNDILKPASGDKYILAGFDTSFVSASYLPAAEQELKERAEQYVEKSKEDPSVYECPMNMVDMITNDIDLNMGHRVKLLNPAYFDAGGRQSRIYGFEKHLDGTKVTYTVGNTSKYSRLAQVENEIKEIVYQGNAYSGSGGGVYVIGRYDNAKAGDRNVFSSLRTLKEIADKALSRLVDDVAAGHITFEDGILVKSKSSPGLLSLALEEEGNGDAETLSLTLIEEGDGNIEILSTALTEQSSGSLEGATLGSLDNVDSSFDTLSDGPYLLEMRDGIFYSVEAGSIGGGSAVMTLTFVSPGVMAVGYGNPAVIEYNFISTSGGESTGNGTAVYVVNGKRVFAGSVPQGVNGFDVGQFLSVGDNVITVEVTDSYGVIRKLTYSINAVSLHIDSTFDGNTVIKGTDFSYRYTPTGAIKKTVHFVLDGYQDITFDTNISNRQLVQILPNKGHGSHTLEVYMTAVIDGANVQSNSLFYDLICTVEGNTTPIISSPFREYTTGQYSTVIIPYSVYDPLYAETDITLVVDGKIVSSLHIGQKLQTWNYRLDKTGIVQLEIVCRDVKKTFHIQVEKSIIDIEAEKTALELYLTSMGRSNSEIERDTWNYDNITAQLTDFNWSTNGWLPDENGNIALKISGNARVTIPIKPFAHDIRLGGKTIEIEFSTHEVTDYQTIIASCMHGGKGFEVTAQSALLRGDMTWVETRFKEEERIRISFVVEENAENRLIYMYINGINSGTKQYAINESFLQVNPQNIVLGSNDCTLYLYNIRIYNNNLTQYQVLDNYIADLDDVEKKIDLYIRNQVYNDYGQLTYEKICRQLPCMTIVGDLPAYKGDKKTVTVNYENRLEPEFSFTADGCQIDVQGTSSQYYPRKNFKTNFKKGFKMTQSGENTDKYKLTKDMVGASVFCEKADFAESSGTHNTGIANLADEILKQMPLYTPPQEKEKLIRTTVCGFPIIIFHKSTNDSEPEFVGKYNFNTDKAAEETFGFSSEYPNCECWEFCNNTSRRMTFQESEYNQPDSHGNPDWLNDFEARYPDDDDLNAAYKSGRIPTQLKRVTDWIVSCKGQTSKFKAECSQYFHIDFLVFYCMFTELLGMVDQRAKNMFLTTWDGEIWYFILYDNDTCLGINNEGEIVFDYNIETTDILGTQNVWNGANSVLWELVESAFSEEIANMYGDLRQRGILSYERVNQYLNTNQSDKWCESVYNEDGRFKYILPMIEGFYDYGQEKYVFTGEYLYALQGSRSDHRKWWLYNRFRYMDSKYYTGQYFADTATLRLYTPEKWAGVKPDGNFALIPYADQYLRVKYGSYVSSAVRGEKGIAHLITAPANTEFNDTETIIYGSSRLKSVGNLSGKYPGTVDMSSASKLEELIIGSGVAGYQNTNLRNVTVKSNKLLRKINIENCPNYTAALDLSGCENIKEIYAKGSGISAVTLASGGMLERMELPASITNIILRNQTNLKSSRLVLEGISNVGAVWIENTPGIDGMALVEQCLKGGKLERVRLTGIDASGEDLSIIFKIMELYGIDEKGDYTDKAVITGTYHVVTVTDYELQRVKEYFPDLRVIYNNIIPAPVTSFVFTSTSTGDVKLDDTNLVAEGYKVERVNDYTFRVPAQTDGEVIDFVFTAKNHRPRTGQYVVSGTRTQNYTATYEALRTIKVKANGEEKYPASRVIVNNVSYDVKENGTVQVRNSDAVVVKVITAGYATQMQTLPAITKDTESTITVYVAVVLQITVTADIIYYKNTYLPGATVVAINRTTGEKYTRDTNDYGDVSFLVSPGFYYDYTVQYKDCEAVSGSEYIYGNGANCTILAPADIRYMQPQENGNIQVMIGTSRHTNQTVSVKSTDAHVIHWGDGSQDTISAGNGIDPVSISHEYANNLGLFQIEVTNVSSVTEFTSSWDIIAYWTVGNSKISNLSFRGAYYTCYIGDVFKNDVNRESFEECFYNASSLLYIQESIFDKCINAKSFISTFHSCKKLKIIPEGLFDNCIHATDFSYCFFRCEAVKSLPAALFEKCPNITTVLSCFYACEKIASIPSNFFIKNNMIVNFESCFSFCKSVNTVPDSLFDYSPEATSLNSCFSDCTSLLNIPEKLFANCTKATSLNSCFSDCTSLEIIPEKLFANNPECTDFGSIFRDCTSLKNIPEGLFANNTKVYSFSNCFDGCTSLESIPENLFANNYLAYSFECCFGYCSSLVEIPESIFDNCASSLNLQYTFAYCKSLIFLTLPPKVTEFSDYTYYHCESLNYIVSQSDAPPTIFSSTFSSTNDCPIYVPDSAVNDYKKATNWIALADRIFPMSQK